jgi:hypothetical protein
VGCASGLPWQLVDQEEIIEYIAQTFPGVEVVRPTDGPGAGDTFFIYDPQHNLDPKRRFPFATVVTKDYGEFDNASRLNRPDVFRLNVGVSSATFRTLFGPTASAEYDFAALDRLMPHPAYASQFWVCVLNPGRETFEGLKPLLHEAYARATRRNASGRR